MQAGAKKLMLSDMESKLAEVLYKKMEHLDPTDGREWTALSTHEKFFYLMCIRTIESERAVIIKGTRTDDDQS